MTKRQRPTRETPRVIAYTRVSTEEQGRSGLGLEAQQAKIEQAARLRGWQTLSLVQEIASGSKLAGRPMLAQALAALNAGEADVLVVAKTDRLARSLRDDLEIREQARSHGWQLVTLDLDLDTTTPVGQMVAAILGSVAQVERDLIASRTREALAAKRAQGARLGGPVRLAQSTRERIGTERAGGQTLQSIADGLNRDGVPTSTGRGQWAPGNVRNVLNSLKHDAAAEAARRATAAA
jgi:hypothetical protein